MIFKIITLVFCLTLSGLVYSNEIQIIESASKEALNQKKYTILFPEKVVVVISLRKLKIEDSFYISSFSVDSPKSNVSVGYANYRNKNARVFLDLGAKVYENVLIDLVNGTCSLETQVESGEK